MLCRITKVAMTEWLESVKVRPVWIANIILPKGCTSRLMVCSEESLGFVINAMGSLGMTRISSYYEIVSE